MKHYKGKQNDALIGSFRFVIENSDGMEKYNFQPTIVNGQELVLGFVEAGYSKGGFGYLYNVKAGKDNCVLLPEKERYTPSWVAYRKRQNKLNFGFELSEEIYNS